MVEKWMRSKPNPYLGTKVRKSFTRPFKPFRGISAHYGKPVNLFKDSDKDGVMNVFDCKPHNRRKQDVLAPLTGGSPMMEMINRQENARQAAWYKRYAEEQQRLSEKMWQTEQDKLAFAQANQNPVTIIQERGGLVYDPSTESFIPYGTPKAKDFITKQKQELQHQKDIIAGSPPTNMPMTKAAPDWISDLKASIPSAKIPITKAPALAPVWTPKGGAVAIGVQIVGKMISKALKGGESK